MQRDRISKRRLGAHTCTFDVPVLFLASTALLAENALRHLRKEPSTRLHLLPQNNLELENSTFTKSGEFHALQQRA